VSFLPSRIRLDGSGVDEDPGTLIRAIPIIAPGMFLSQPPTHDTAVHHLALAAGPIESAITFRAMRANTHPSWPCDPWT